jgi:hypothetical protein
MDFSLFDYMFPQEIFLLASSFIYLILIVVCTPCYVMRLCFWKAVAPHLAMVLGQACLAIIVMHQNRLHFDPAYAAHWGHTSRSFETTIFLPHVQK